MVDSKLIKLAVDAYHGRLGQEYSTADTMEVLRKALVEANNGSTTLNYKDLRDGKCQGLFSIIEVMIDKINEEGLKGDEFFANFIEDRNLALGDKNTFHVDRDCLFAVADIAEGTQGVRRQRIESGSDVTVDTQLRAVKIYEEVNRVLSGRIDFNKFVDLVGQSFTRDDLDSAYAAWTGMFTNLAAPYTQTGTFDEEKLMDLIAHVEASTGDTAIIVGTQKALRKITTAVISDEAKSDMYSLGHYGKFNGTEMVMMKQRHRAGTTDFILNDNVIYVFAGDTKPVKRITEGEVTMLMGDPMTNADLSQEFLMMKRTGIAIVMDRDFGAYNLA